MAKRICAVVLAVTMLITMLVTGISAVRASADTESATVTFDIGTVEAVKGDYVEIPISISENSQLVNADLYVRFDATKLNLDETYFADTESANGECCYQVNTELIKGGWMYLGNEVEPGVFRFVMATGGSGLTASGEIIRLGFEVLTDEPGLAELEFEASPCVGFDGTDDYDIAYSVNAGGVYVLNDVLIGDFDGNGTVNMRDIMQFYRAFSAGTTMTEAQIAACDYDGNGSINMRDVMNIYRGFSKGTLN